MIVFVSTSLNTEDFGNRVDQAHCLYRTTRRPIGLRHCVDHNGCKEQYLSSQLRTKMDHFQSFYFAEQWTLKTQCPVPVGYVNASTKQLAWNYPVRHRVGHPTWYNQCNVGTRWDVVAVECTELNLWQSSALPVQPKPHVAVCVSGVDAACLIADNETGRVVNLASCVFWISVVCLF